MVQPIKRGGAGLGLKMKRVSFCNYANKVTLLKNYYVMSSNLMDTIMDI